MNQFHATMARSGHSPELPLDSIDLSTTFAANHADFLEEVMQEEDEQLYNAKLRGYELGLAEGTRNLHGWCVATAIGTFVLLLLFVGAFPEAAAMFMSQPAPLSPAAQASLTAIPR